MTFDRLRNRFRKRLAVIVNFFSFAATEPATQNFGSQRMCPFCRLITPRSGRFCLECGKSLGNT